MPKKFKNNQSRKSIFIYMLVGTLISTIISTSLLISSAIAATSTVIVTSTPYLSFTDVPDSILMGTLTVPTANTALVSDIDGNLPAVNHLTISDTRGDGGLSLQIQASDFSPASEAMIPANIRVVTSTNDQLSESEIGRAHV